MMTEFGFAFVFIFIFMLCHLTSSQ